MLLHSDRTWQRSCSPTTEPTERLQFCVTTSGRRQTPLVSLRPTSSPRWRDQQIFDRDKKWWYVVMSYFSSTFTSVCLLSSFNTSRLSAGVSSRHWPRVSWSCPRRSKLTAQTASCRHEWPLLVADRLNTIAHKGKTISWLNTPFCVRV